jgi:hypothetical protein
MSTSNQSVRGTSTPVGAATSTKITNLSLPTANTEVSHALSSNLKQLIIRNRGNQDLKMSFTATESGTKYITIAKWATLSLTSLSFASETLYLQCATASQTVEILELY